MKTFGLTLILALISVLNINHTIAQDSQQDGPVIEFVKVIHDFGEVKYGEEAVCTFEFKNTGNAPLIISDAKKSCGCTVPSWPKEPIAPGATGKITVKYDTKRPGPINKSVTIISNATNEPTKVLRIKGHVLEKAE